MRRAGTACAAVGDAGVGVVGEVDVDVSVAVVDDVVIARCVLSINFACWRSLVSIWCCDVLCVVALFLVMCCFVSLLLGTGDTGGVVCWYMLRLFLVLVVAFSFHSVSLPLCL